MDNPALTAALLALREHLERSTQAPKRRTQQSPSDPLRVAAAEQGLRSLFIVELAIEQTLKHPPSQGQF